MKQKLITAALTALNLIAGIMAFYFASKHTHDGQYATFVFDFAVGIMNGFLFIVNIVTLTVDWSYSKKLKV
jgi:hypothetical protein